MGPKSQFPELSYRDNSHRSVSIKWDNAKHLEQCCCYHHYYCSYYCYLYPLRIWLLGTEVPKREQIKGFLTVKQEVRRQAMIGFGLAAQQSRPKISAVILAFPLWLPLSSKVATLSLTSCAHSRQKELKGRGQQDTTSWLCLLSRSFPISPTQQLLHMWH